jgi:kynurenine formamidase
VSDDRWQGWRLLPPPAALAPDGAWVELSHPLHEGLRGISWFPTARFSRLKSMPGDPLNLTAMQMVCHFGTHVDARRISSRTARRSTDSARPAARPRRRVARRRRAVRRDRRGHARGDAPRAAGRDIVLLDAGWAAHCGTDTYDRHPRLGLDAADWLVAHGAKLVGIDFPTPDLAVDRRPPGFDWPVHHRLLRHGVLIAENLTNVRPLAGRRIEAMFLALNILESDGAPARAIARPIGLTEARVRTIRSPSHEERWKSK